MIAPCSNGVIKYNAVVVNSRDESIEFAVLIWPPPCIFNGHCDVGPLRMAPRLVLRTIGSSLGNSKMAISWESWIPSKHAYWWYKIVLCIDTLSKLVFCCGFPGHRMVVVGSRFSMSKCWLKKCHSNNIHPTGCSTYSHDFTACFDHATCFQTL